jgi:hypothetical protein
MSIYPVAGTSTRGGCLSLRCLAAGGRGDEIWHRRGILLLDLREDPAFGMDSEWWDCPTYEPCLRRRLSLLGNGEYDYDADPYPQQQVPHWVPPPPEEEQEEEEEDMEVPVLLVEQYQPPDLLDEEALQRAIEESELV